MVKKGEMMDAQDIVDLLSINLIGTIPDDENVIVYRKTADLGQIIVSVETAERQKKETLEKEILTLIIHGILHLFGFDHLTKKDYDFVVRMQNEIIEEL